MSEALTLIYRDTDLVAVDKPAGLLVHRSPLDRHETRFALQIVRDQIGQRVWPVHRLDKGTSGLLLFALDPAVARALGQTFASRTVEKRYLALVRGWPAAQGEVEHALAPDDEPGPPQEASTGWRRLARIECPWPDGRHPSSRYALLEVEPLTGRRHQIRRHLKHLAHPLIGDATHGKGAHNRQWAEVLGQQRLWLHAASLALAHPVSGVALRLIAPPGPDWARLRALPGWIEDPTEDQPKRSA